MHAMTQITKDNNNIIDDKNELDQIADHASGVGSQIGLIASIRTYPISVFLMLGNEFCERFSYIGMSTILILYFISEHRMSDRDASLAYHAFVALVYLMPLFGSIIADNYLGKFRVILMVCNASN